MRIAKKGHKISWLLVLTGLIFFTFSPCLKNGFVNWDEDRYLLGNSAIKDLSPQGFVKLFDPHIVGIYIPLTLVTYSFEYHCFKLNPVIYHLDNLILHFFNVLLVFWLIYLLTSKFEVALITAALFGVSPLRVESVAWVMERKDVLYSLFYLGALISYIKFIKSRLSGYYGWALFLFLCSLLAKPQAITLPFMMLVIEHYCDQRPWSKPLLLQKAPFCLAGMFIFVFSLIGYQRSLVPSESLSKLWFASYTLVLFFIKSFIPFQLCCFYFVPQEIHGHFFWTVGVSMAVVLGAGWLIIKQYSKDRDITFSFLFYVILMALPIFNMRYSHGLFYEHYTYLPSVGIYFLFASVFIKRLGLLHSRRLKQTALLLLGGYILVNSVLSFERCSVWKNAITFWSDVIQHHPKDMNNDLNIVLAYNNRGLAYYYQGKISQAMSDYNKSIGIDPIYSKAYLNRGLAYYSQGQLSQAILDFNKAVEFDPNFAMAYNNRGWTFYNQGKILPAISDYNKAIEVDPDFEMAYNNRGWAYFNQGKISQAFADYNKALGIDPFYSKAYLDRGLAYYSRGKIPEAISDYTKAVEIDPNYAWAYNDRGLAYDNQGKWGRAVSDYNKSISIDPHIAMAYNNRGWAYYNQGKIILAFLDYNKSISMDPHIAMAYNNRGWAYYNQGKSSQALSDFNKTIEEDPNFSKAYYNRALVYKDRGNFKQAISEFSKAISLDPDHADTFYYRGLLWDRLGNYSQAILDYTKALEIDPNYADAYNHRALSLENVLGKER